MRRSVNATWAGRIISQPFIGLMGIIWLAAGCDSNVIPVDGELHISPEAHSIQSIALIDENGHCFFIEENTMDIPLVFQLKTSGGSPIGNALINVYSDFSANTYAGVPVLKLYEDLNGNGVVDAESELISGDDTDIPRIRTERYTGSKSLLLRINLSCPYRAEIRGFVDGITATSVIQVTTQPSQVVELNAMGQGL